MERKNTVLLTVIAVATLLVAVVGATFAYFTATATGSGSVENATSNVETAKIADISFTKEGIQGTTNVIYPGTMNAVGTGITTKINGEGVTNTYEIDYTLTANINLKSSTDVAQEFKHPIKWRLYELAEKVDSDLVTCPASPTIETEGNENKYSITCTENEDFDPESNGDNLVASGVINEASECSPESSDPKNQTACGSSVTISYKGKIDAKTSETKKYYYLVVEYTKIDASQNEDIGKKMEIKITDVTVDSTKDKAAA